MSKYNALWEYVKNSGAQSLKLTFDEIQNIAGVPIDHSFLTSKGACGLLLSGRENLDERKDCEF